VQQIGRYEIESELNRGALSATFRAQDSSGSSVAIRTVHIAALEDETEQKELRRALHQLGKTQAGFRHRHVIPVREVIEERDFVHLLSDFVEAPRLADVLRAGTAIPTGIAALWLRQLASALDEVHKRGFIHGALWPNNIFIENAPVLDAKNDDSVLRVSDFEVACLVAKYSPHTDPGEEALRFLSPEQIQEAAIAGGADQFALGVLAYLLLTGTKPFDADHLATLYFRICKEEPRPLKEQVPALSDRATEAIARALSKSPEQRYSNCLDFVNALAASAAVAIGGFERPNQPAATAIEAPEYPKDRDTPTQPVQPPPQPHTGERAYLLPEKSRSGRKLALAFVFGILIGAGVWVSRYWKPSVPVPVQVADPDRAPSSPPPGEAAKGVPERGPVVGPRNSPADEDSSPAKQNHEEPPKNSTEPARDGANEPPATSSVPPPPLSKPANPAVKGPANVTGSDAPPDSHRLTSVQLVSDPVGARISVDDDDANTCIAPCTLNLGPGRHTLVATIAGSAPARRIFLVPPDKAVTVVMPRSLGTLLVASSPSGAQVLIDGQSRGQTPTSVRLPAGPHRLVVVLNAEQRVEQTVLVEEDRIVTRTIRW
jgi:serine/threonine protein kinase